MNQNTMKMKLNKVQVLCMIRVIKELLSQYNHKEVIITGLAGTGKSSLISYLAGGYRHFKKKVALNLSCVPDLDLFREKYSEIQKNISIKSLKCYVDVLNRDDYENVLSVDFDVLFIDDGIYEYNPKNINYSKSKIVFFVVQSPAIVYDGNNLTGWDELPPEYQGENSFGQVLVSCNNHEINIYSRLEGNCPIVTIKYT